MPAYVLKASVDGQRFRLNNDCEIFPVNLKGQALTVTTNRRIDYGVVFSDLIG